MLTTKNKIGKFDTNEFKNILYSKNFNVIFDGFENKNESKQENIIFIIEKNVENQNFLQKNNNCSS